MRKRLDLYVEENTYIKLKGLPGTITEHVKRAITEYLDNMYKVNVSASQSQRKGGK